MDREYSIDDLVTAKLNAAEFSGKHPDLDEFHASRYRALALSFGIDERADSDDFDREDLTHFAQDAVKAYLNLRSPFGSYLEAPPIIVDLHQEFAPAINDGLGQTKAAIKALVIGVFSALHAIPEGRTVRDEDLRRNGFDPSTPWPDEFDYL